jgi:phage shock protein C
MGRKTFNLDRGNGKVMGVCAGLAEYTGVDVTLIRVALVVVTLAGAFPWTLIAYGIAAWMAGPRRSRRRAARELAMPRTSTYEMRETMREIDQRMAEVESYVTTSNPRLAEEIESLR